MKIYRQSNTPTDSPVLRTPIRLWQQIGVLHKVTSSFYPLCIVLDPLQIWRWKSNFKGASSPGRMLNNLEGPALILVESGVKVTKRMFFPTRCIVAYQLSF